MSNYGSSTVHNVYSVSDRLKLINDQVFASSRDPETRALALELVRGTVQHGDQSEIQELSRVFWFVKNNIEYRQDPFQYDLYATAKRTLQMKAGDCDDHTILVGALISNLGFIPGAKIVSPDNANWHIYAVTCVWPRSNPDALTARYVALDTTQTPSVPGWEPPPAFQRYRKLVTFSDRGPIIKEL
jgi:hypothetical protein